MKNKFYSIYSWIIVFWTILKRDLIPAGDGTGFKQFISYRLLISYLPTLGVIFLIVFISGMGLILVSMEHRLDESLKELETSPYMAFFGEGIKRFGGNDLSSLSAWRKVKINEVCDITDKAGENIAEEPLFAGGVYPYRKVYMYIKPFDQKSASFMGYSGILLSLSGDIADRELIEEIKKRLLPGGNMPQDHEEGIIFSRHTLSSKLRYPEDRFPEVARVQLQKDKPFVPVIISGTVDRLPYGIDFVITKNLFQKLESGYFYSEVDFFDILFPEGYPGKENFGWLRNDFKGIKIGEVTIDTGMEKVYVELPEAYPVYEILEKLMVSHPKKYLFEFPESPYAYVDDSRDNQVYSGAILHLNGNFIRYLIQRGIQGRYDATDQYDPLSQIQEFMADQGLKVRGEFVHSLQTTLASQSQISQLRVMFKYAIWAVFLIFLCYFSMTLHARMHRIGTMEIMGAPDHIFFIVNFSEALIFLTLSFVMASFLIYMFEPLDLGLKLLSPKTRELFIRLFIFSEIGILVPTFVFLRLLKPVEMVAYRS